MSSSAKLLATTAALALVVACGGKATGSSPRESESEPSVSGSDGKGGGSARVPVDEKMLAHWDDRLPWFQGSGSSRFPNDGEDVLLHLQATGSPARGTLSTHLPSDALSWTEAVKFSARASAPLRLLVSLGHVQRTYDYFARPAGDEWPMASVDVGQEWQTFSIDKTEFVPPQSEADQAVPFFFLAFVVDNAAPVDVWIDNVVFIPPS